MSSNSFFPLCFVFDFKVSEFKCEIPGLVTPYSITRKRTIPYDMWCTICCTFDVSTLFHKQYNIKIDGDNYPAGGVFALLNIFTENVEVLEFQLKTSFLRQLREWSNVSG